MEKIIVLAVEKVENLDELALELGCKTGTLPTSYLGLPLGKGCNSILVWDGVEERFRKKNLPFGKDSLFPKEEGLLSYEAHY